MPKPYLPIALAAVMLAAPLGIPTARAQTAAPAKAEAEAGKVTAFTLDNGLQVVVIPDRRAPVVTHMVWYKAGSADEQAGVSGIAHYLEHLMFKGTKTVPAGEFSGKVTAIGGSENAFTSNDYTAYFQRVTPDLLPEVMRLEADRMENLVLDADGILAERDVVNEERNQRTENDPGSLLREAMEAALYQNHRYGVPIIGWQHEVNALTKEDAITFYDRFYTPNNAILVVAGDVDADTVRKLAADTYAKVERRAEPGERARPSEPEPRAARRLEMADARVSTPSFSRMYLVPPYAKAAPGEAEAMDVLAEVLGGGTTSRLYKAAVLGEQNATAAGAYYRGGSLDMTEFGIYGAPRGDADLDALEATLDTAIDTLIKDGVTQAEVDRAVKRLVRSEIFDRDSQSTLARVYGAALSVGMTIEDVEQWPDRLRAVTPESVDAAARKYLRPERSVTGRLLPDSSAAAATGVTPTAPAAPADPAADTTIEEKG